MKWSLFFKVLAVMGVVSEWSTRALADGKVTTQEAADLGVRLAAALGIEVITTIPE